MRTALTIAGSDSSGHAGIQADLRTMESLGVRAVSAVTAVTAQNVRGITAVLPLPADLVTAQVEAVVADGPIHATKIGMLGNAAIAEAVAAAIEELELPLVVLDPVIASTTGTRLLDDDGVQTLMSELISRVLVVTPNIPEAEALSGRRIETIDDIRDAARRLHHMGARHVLIKGGHRTARAGRKRASADVIDVLFDGIQFREMKVQRVPGRAVHGTGCAHASAMTAYLALGRDLPTAATKAQLHVSRLIARTYTER